MMLTHRFAFYPPVTASASRGFLQARSCSAVCLAAGRDCTTLDASEPTSATQHVFDYEHPRLVDSRLLVFAVTRLSPRAGTGNRAFHDAQFASAGRAALFRGGAFSSPNFPELALEPRAVRPYLWHLCRLPVSYPWRFRTHGSSSGPPRLHSPRVREDHTMSTTRDAFHR